LKFPILKSQEVESIVAANVLKIQQTSQEGTRNQPTLIQFIKLRRNQSKENPNTVVASITFEFVLNMDQNTSSFSARTELKPTGSISDTKMWKEKYLMIPDDKRTYIQ